MFIFASQKWNSKGFKNKFRLNALSDSDSISLIQSNKDK